MVSKYASTFRRLFNRIVSSILPHKTLENCYLFKHALSGLRQFLAIKPFKNDEKYFLFHLKSFFDSQDI